MSAPRDFVVYDGEPAYRPRLADQSTGCLPVSRWRLGLMVRRDEQAHQERRGTAPPPPFEGRFWSIK